MANEELKIVLSADAEKLQKEFKQIQKYLKQQTDTIAQSVNSMLPSFSNIEKASKNLNKNMTSTVKSINSMTTSLDKSVTSMTKVAEQAAKIKRELTGIDSDVDVNINENRTSKDSSASNNNSMNPVVPALAGAGLGAGLANRSAPVQMPTINTETTTRDVSKLKELVISLRNDIQGNLNRAINGVFQDFETHIYSTESTFAKNIEKTKAKLKELGVVAPLRDFQMADVDGVGKSMVKSKSDWEIDPNDESYSREDRHGAKFGRRGDETVIQKVGIELKKFKATLTEVYSHTKSMSSVIKALGIHMQSALGRGLYNAIYKTGAAVNKLRTQYPLLNSALNKCSQTTKRFATSCKNAVPKMKAISKSMNNLIKINPAYGRAMDKVKKKTKEAGDQAAKSTGGFKSMLKSVAAFAGIGMAFNFMKESIIAGMSEIENDNVFRTAFNDEVLSDMYKFCDGAIDKFGMTTDAAKKLSAEFMLLGANLSGSKEVGLEMSKTLTQLTVDFGSFYNVSNERAATLMQQGLTGETEGLKRFGIIVNETMTKNYAYANGIAEVGKELNESQKVMARYGLMQSQMKQVNGDFASTQHTTANQLKILTATLQQTKIELGKAFDPILRNVLPILNVFLTGLNKVISTFGLFMEALFGKKMNIKGAEDAGNSLGNLGSSAENAGNQADAAAKKFKGLMGFDEINVLGSESDSKGSGAGAGGSVEVPNLDWETEDAPMTTIPPAIQAMADGIKKIAGTIFKPIKDAWDNVGPALTTQIDLAWINIGGIFTKAKETIGSIWENGGSDIFQNLIEILLQVATIAGRVFNESLIPMISGFLDFLDPEKNPVTRLFLKAIEGITEAVKKLCEYLAGDGFWIVDAFFKAWAAWKIWGVVAAVYGFITAMVLSAVAKAVDIGLTIAIIALYAKDFALAIFGAMKSVFMFIGSLLAQAGAGILTVASLVATTAAQVAQTTATGILTGATWLLNAALAVLTSPIFLVILAIGLLVLAFIYCYNKFEWFRNMVDGIVKALIEIIKGLVNGIIGYFSTMFESIKEAWGNICGIFTGIIDFITGVFTGNWEQAWDGVVSIFKNVFGGLINIAKMPLNAIISLINGVIGGLNKIKFPSWVPIVGDKGINIPEIPKLARGKHSASRVNKFGKIGEKLIYIKPKIRYNESIEQYIPKIA